MSFLKVEAYILISLLILICQGYGYHIPNSSRLNLDRTHRIPCPIREQPSDIGGDPHKEG